MDTAQAIAKAKSILDEERMLPTVDYIDPLAEWQECVTKYGIDIEPTSAEGVKAMKGREKYGNGPRLNLYTERRMRPRPVHESPYDYAFKSVNFNLLRILFSQVQESERGQFISGLLSRVPSANASNYLKDEARFPSYHRSMSELPLVAEFCIRTGYVQELLKAVSSMEKPTIGLVTLLLELEEIIALNFNLFSDQELATIAESLSPLSNLCEQVIRAMMIKRLERTFYLSQDLAESEAKAKEIKASIEGIREECRKARYYYLKDALLQETPNLEIESDKTKVIGFLDSLGFDPLLTASLARAEELYRASSDAFDLKECLGHIRSFYEHMNRDAGQALAKSLGTTIVDEWDPTLTFFKNNRFLSPQQDKFARGLYTLLSDEGVHALIAEREFARLLRNMVIEYGLMFLTMLEKKGIKIQASKP
jgi:hypothetical protein